MTTVSGDVSTKWSMDENIKTKWLAALRSEEYRQGQDVLKQAWGENDKPQFCCLGVLCDIAIKEGLNLHIEEDLPGSTHTVWEFDGSRELLPESVMVWAGLNSHNPEVNDPHDGVTDLASLNDNGVGFAEIADIIEREL